MSKSNFKGNVTNTEYMFPILHALEKSVEVASSRAQLIEIYRAGKKVLKPAELDVLIASCRLQQARIDQRAAE